MTLGMIVSYRMLTNISIEHFLNTATTELFHWMRWSQMLNLNNPRWKTIFEANLPASFHMHVVYHNICRMFVFSPEYMWSSKVTKLCLSTLSETNRWPLSVYLSLSDQWLCNNWEKATLYLKSWRAESFRLVSHICTSKLDRGTGSALVQV